MRLGIVCLSVALLAPLVPVAVPQGEAVHPTRRLLYPANQANLNPALKETVGQLLAKRNEMPDPAQVHTAGANVFVRILQQRFVVDKETDQPVKDARLGSRPFVFLTLPEALHGRTLPQIFAAVGYSLEDAYLKNAGKEIAAVVFTYPEGYRVHPAGKRLPDEDWDRRIYPATWCNVFDLTEQMVRGSRFVVGSAGKDDAPKKLALTSEAEKAFVLGYPLAGKDRLRRATYAALQRTGGADWEYRQLLERCWGASEHFRGDGRTKLTFGSAPGSQRGFPEYLGPNLALAEAEAGALAVIYLGTLKISE
jgi:hypothetical protein